jgi:tetratricopeptide (TPR) repeat protein
LKPGDVQSKLDEARKLLLSHDFARALPHYERLTRQCPNAAVIWFEYGSAASSLRRMDLADQAWRKARDLDPRNSELVGMIGHRYQALRQTFKAQACFAQAAALDPRAINPRVSLAVLSEQNHQLAQARTAIDECLAIDPRDDQARYFQAVLDRREGHLDTAEQRLRDLIASNPKHPYVRYACRYELAQVLDRTDRFDEAIGLLLEAKQIVRALTDTEMLIQGYDEGAESARRFTRALPKNILESWAQSFPQQERSAMPQLAFLGGHPRSGTTLLERILDSHPAVAALDEPTAFLDVLQPAFHKCENLSSSRLNSLRDLYLQAFLQEAGPAAAGKLLVDKNPSPTARLPLWLKVFPELRVLIALRDPRDVVLSCFFQNIPLNAVNVNFLSLDRLARHYADLMDIWLTVRDWDGFQWLETKYEDTVADMEKEGRRVTAFLGLTWHEEQARFYEKSRQKQHYSPTYQDVTRPIYTRSVARWRAYEKHLAPILGKLQPYCREFGYEQA